VGTLLAGFGLFHLVDGIIDPHLLGLHHGNETVPPAQWLYWDTGFLVWGALMLRGGWRLLRVGWQETQPRVLHPSFMPAEAMTNVLVSRPTARVQVTSGTPRVPLRPLTPSGTSGRRMGGTFDTPGSLGIYHIG
jgi:Predicted membrane protein (DUF2243)